MKKIVFIALLSCLLLSCTKWFNPPTDVLPPYSEKGANTFGCTVDGRILVPQDTLLDPTSPLYCGYQMVNWKRSFVLVGEDKINNFVVSIILDSTVIKQDSVYYFDNYYTSTNSARYQNDSNVIYYTKLPNYTGELNIKHFDSVKCIVSGTFWFDAYDSVSSRVVKVRDGRFDVRFNY